MMNKLKIAILGSAAIILPILSFAHEGETEVIAQVQIEKTQPDLKTAVVEKREAIKNTANEVRANISEKRDMLKTEVMEKRDAIKNTANEVRANIAEKRDMLKTEVVEKRDALKTEVMQKREVLKLEIKNLPKERVKVLKEKVSEERAQKIEAFFGSMVRKFEAAISRLRILADRIDSRLDKLEDKGRDITTLRAALDDARNTIETAEDALDKAKEEFTTFASAENPKEYFEKVKLVVQDVASKVKISHKALVDVINSVKGISDNSQ